MKFYYLLSFLNTNDENYFIESIKYLKSPEDIDKLIKNKYYRVYKKIDSSITHNSFILETWVFIKYVWENYNIQPSEINWIYWDNLVIQNEDLYVFKDEWTKISIEENIYFCTSRFNFSSSFWHLFEKISNINPKFPKLFFPNKNLINNKNDDKIKYIINIYENRKELVGDFMLPLFHVNSIYNIKNILILWKQLTNKNEVVLKWSWRTDNWKNIKILKIDEYIKNDNLLDYLYMKHLWWINENTWSYYFINHYDIKEELRLYFAKNINWKYNIYSAKEKINLTKKEELFDKINFHTWLNVKVKWKIKEIENIPKKLINIWQEILTKNNIDVWVIEFIKEKNWWLKFLEINTLWWSMMFEGNDENNIKNRIYDWWDNLFFKNNIKNEKIK